MTAARPDRCAPSHALLLLLLSLLLLCRQLTCATAATDDASAFSSSSTAGSSVACSRWSCGPMPMVLVRCADGTNAGYRCQDVNGRCTMMPPHCASGPLTQFGPINRTASDVDSSSGDSVFSSSSSSSTLAAFPNADPAVSSSSSSASLIPAAASSTSSSSSSSSLPLPAVAVPTPVTRSQSPMFNCSRQQCGPMIALYVLSCPSGRSAHPLCAWLSSAGRCGYLSASCDYPDFRDPPLAADCEEGGGCVLPQYVRYCGAGQTVAPYCRWDDDSGRCAAVEPQCPSASPAAADRSNDSSGSSEQQLRRDDGDPGGSQCIAQEHCQQQQATA